MEKWAKKLNAQKEHLKEEVKPPVAEPIIDISSVSLPSSASADAGFSLLEKVNVVSVSSTSVNVDDTHYYSSLPSFLFSRVDDSEPRQLLHSGRGG